MRIKVGKKNSQMDISRLALVQRAGHTYVFGAAVDEKELNALRTNIPFKIAYNRGTERWELGSHVSQAIQHGQSTVAWIAWFGDRLDTLFFIYEEFAMDGDRANFDVSRDRVGMYDITTPDNKILSEHATDATLDKLLRQHFPEDYILPELGEEIVLTQDFSEFQQTTADERPFTTVVIPYEDKADILPSEPEEIDPEFDERPHSLRPHLSQPAILDKQMLDAIMDTSMVATTEEVVQQPAQLTISRMELGFIRHREEMARIRDVYSEEDFPKIMGLRALAQRYVQMIRVDSSSHIDHTIDHYGPCTSVSHLLWMLNEIESNTDQSVTKKHRWMGFVQAYLTVYGFTTVARERNYTRDLFGGQ